MMQRRITTEIYEFATATLGIVRAMGAEEAGFIPEHFWHEDRYWGVRVMVLTRENWTRYRGGFVDVIDVERRFDARSAADRVNGHRSTDRSGVAPCDNQ